MAILASSACNRASPPQRNQDGRWRFSDAKILESVRVEPSPLTRGAPFQLTWEGSPGVEQGLVWGILPSVDAGWQHYPRVQAPAWTHKGARWWSMPPGAPHEIELEVPAHWQDRNLSVVAYRQRGASLLAVESGARLPSADPPNANAARLAVTALVPLQPRPLQIPVMAASEAMRCDASDEDWPQQASRYPLVDSLNGNAVHSRTTQLRFAWNKRALFVFAQLQDPDLWAPHQKRDDPLYRKEALELFLASDGSNQDYLELQISAANVVFDARYRRHRKGERAWDGQWEHAVQVDGTLHQRKDRDRGWNAELALPWEELCAQTRLHCPPRPGTRIRVNVFRVESPRPKIQEGTALSATYRPDFHAMDRAAILILN